MINSFVIKCIECKIPWWTKPKARQCRGEIRGWPVCNPIWNPRKRCRKTQVQIPQIRVCPLSINECSCSSCKWTLISTYTNTFVLNVIYVQAPPWAIVDQLNKTISIWSLISKTMAYNMSKTRAALGAVEPLGRHQYLKHELHAIGPSKMQF